MAACILVAVAGITAFTSAPAPVIRIVASDYAFIDVPPVVRPGLTYFALKNAGKVRHEMALLRLEPGIGVSDAIQNEKGGGKGRAKFFKTVGLLIEPPGGSTIGWLAMELRSGETYVLICSLRDHPDAPQHFDLGMYSAFAVR
jgi:hypothetical protein